MTTSDWEVAWLEWKEPSPLDVGELAILLLRVEQAFTLREGYAVKIEGSCHKGPQGINYSVIKFGEFESEAGMRMMEKILLEFSF